MGTVGAQAIGGIKSGSIKEQQVHVDTSLPLYPWTLSGSIEGKIPNQRRFAPLIYSREGTPRCDNLIKTYIVVMNSPNSGRLQPWQPNECSTPSRGNQDVTISGYKAKPEDEFPWLSVEMNMVESKGEEALSPPIYQCDDGSTTTAITSSFTSTGVLLDSQDSQIKVSTEDDQSSFLQEELKNNGRSARRNKPVS